MSERPMSLMMRKLRAQEAWEAQNPTESDRPAENDQSQEPFRRAYCFFYGTLMDPDTFSQVLELPKTHTPPVMRRARVIGYEVKLWGPYPALHDKPLNPVKGMAYEVLSQTQIDRLAAYETEKYCLSPCLIDLLNDDDSVGETIAGFTFLWNGEQDELLEGTFDLKQWKKEKELRHLHWLLTKTFL